MSWWSIDAFIPAFTLWFLGVLTGCAFYYLISSFMRERADRLFATGGVVFVSGQPLCPTHGLPFLMVSMSPLVVNKQPLMVCPACMADRIDKMKVQPGVITTPIRNTLP